MTKTQPEFYNFENISLENLKLRVAWDQIGRYINSGGCKLCQLYFSRLGIKICCLVRKNKSRTRRTITPFFEIEELVRFVYTVHSTFEND